MFFLFPIISKRIFNLLLASYSSILPTNPDKGPLKISKSYIPKDTVIGLSKINRLVGFFAQRPQVQERLTQQVLVALQTLTNTEDVSVSINATHYCVKARGIRDTNSYTKTSALGGRFLTDNELKREFFR